MNWWDILLSVAKVVKAVCEIAIAAVLIHTGLGELRRMLRA